MKWQKTLRLLTIGLCLVLLNGCSQPSDTDPTASQGDEGPIVIGGIMPLTAEGAAYGILGKNIGDLKTQQINAQGGIKGRELIIQWEDGRCLPSEASKVAQKLVNADKVSVIFGGACSGETLAAAPITEKAEVVLFSPMSSSPEITEAGDFVFRSAPSDNSQGRVLAAHVRDQGHEKVGVLFEQTDYASGIARAFEEHFEGEIISESYLMTESDFKTRITKLKNEAITALLIIPQTPAKAEIIIKQLQEQDFSLPLIFNDVVVGNQELVENNAEFFAQVEASGTNFVAPQNDQLDALIADYQEAFGKKPNYINYAATTADGFDMLTQVLAQVEAPSDSKAIRDALYQIQDFDGIYQDLSFDENGDSNITHSVFVFDDETRRFELAEY